ncbi:Sapep family Mn(2+)-dependent dipeptidase [Peptacetobacter hiranonis]|uniref:Sapep family Mn(2+)-dependent dipeptidase n=1 Tax=Peptacetobacter hiranonis TaxID=89152 RepID=UPI0019175AAF|nr:Sapep family Mn(2+)-dependent dipeptidase [Peptacetobacter hiranonis]QQQ87613.1 Sapep family Mn(2+)-dependent dipeptidase [Peptacetobacter hiranonis]
MESKIKNIVNENSKDMIESIKAAVRINSVMDEDTATESMPFGKGVDESLRKTLEIAESLGFKTVYKDGYYGYAEVGEGEELIGILGHIDVVPIGDESKWKFPPFSATEEDGYIYGRGAQDDKGPTIAAMYAVKALLDAGVKFGKRVRFIIGGDEENLWRCIAKYTENGEEIPSMGFTPDSSFPVTNAEKSLVQFYLRGKGSKDLSLNISGALNAVPGVANYTGKLADKLSEKLDELKFDYEKDGESITVIGKRVHAASADKGVNAIERLCKALYEIGVEDDVVRFVAELSDSVGSKILPNCIDDVSGTLTLNLGELIINEKESKIGFDSRVPVKFTIEDLEDAVKEKAANYELEFEEFDRLKSLYVPADSELIKTLVSVYEQETGLEGTPKSSGGATYAKALDNCVAFGAMFPFDEKTEHQENERVNIKNMIKATEIYALSVYRLLEI